MYKKITFEKIVVRNSSLPIIKIRCLFDIFSEKKIQQTPNFNLIAPIIKIRCLFDIFTGKKIQQTPNFNLITPTKMNMKTKQGKNINNEKKTNKQQLKRNECRNKC